MPENKSKRRFIYHCSTILSYLEQAPEQDLNLRPTVPIVEVCHLYTPGI